MRKEVLDLVGKPYDPLNWNCYSLVSFITGSPTIEERAENLFSDSKKIQMNLKKYNNLYDEVQIENLQENDIFITKNHTGVVIKINNRLWVIHTKEFINTIIEPLENLQLQRVRFIRLKENNDNHQ